MLKNRIRIGNIAFAAFTIILFFAYYFAVTAPVDNTDGSFRKKDFIVTSIYSEDSPIEINDVITHINGETLNDILTNRFSGIKFYNFEVGDKLTYTVLREEEKLEIPVTLVKMPQKQFWNFSYNYLIAFLIGLTGYISFITSPKTKTVIAFLFNCLAIGITLAPGIFEAFNISFPLYMFILYSMIGPISGLSLMSIPLFFLIFPTDLLGKFKKPYIIGNIILIILLNLIPFILPITAILKHYYIVQGYYFYILYISFSFILGVILNFVKTKDIIKRQQLKYISLGIWLSVVPGLLLLIIPFFITRKVILNYEILTTLMLIFPFMTMLSIKKYELFNVKKIRNKTLAYSLTSLVTTGVSILLFSFFAYLLKFPINSDTIISLIPVIIFSSITAIPLQNAIEKLWQKLFHRNALEFFNASENILEDLAKAKEYNSLFNYATTILPNKLKVKESLLVLIKKDGLYTKDKYKFEKWEKYLDKEEKDFQLLRNLPFITYTEEIPALKNNEIKKFQLIIPIIEENQTKALWFLGEKMSEDFYYGDELETLKIIAKQLSLSLLNSKLILTLQEKAEKEKDLLEKEIELKSLKEEYITIVSHFLRTPISATKGFIELLKTELKGNKTAIDYIASLSASTEKIHMITERIIIMSELEQGKLELTLREEKLVDLLNSIVNNAESTMQEYNIDVKLVVKHKPTIFAERNKLKQALSNILENAIIYNKPKGKVKIKVETIKNKAIITIKDTGRGISKEELKKLFTPFHRAHYKNVGFIKGEGIGIGIYLTKLIIEAHKGNISYESEIDKGTTVTIKLPIYDKKKK